jgi:transcriptional repressor NF-X1
MSDIQSGNTVDLTTYFSSKERKLECNETCGQIERNKRLALALQIENPDISTKLSAPKYSDFLKEFGKKDPNFVQSVHDRLTDLVKLAKESKQKSRQYSFECMNRDKRQFVHEYSDHFGIDSESYDAEPKRNVIATAFRDRVWLPSQSIIDVVQGQRRAPGPINLKGGKGSTPTTTTLQKLSNPWNGNQSAAAVTKHINSSSSKEEVIDYFDLES